MPPSAQGMWDNNLLASNYAKFLLSFGQPLQVTVSSYAVGP